MTPVTDASRVVSGCRRKTLVDTRQGPPETLTPSRKSSDPPPHGFACIGAAYSGPLRAVGVSLLIFAFPRFWNCRVLSSVGMSTAQHLKLVAAATSRCAEGLKLGERHG